MQRKQFAALIVFTLVLALSAISVSAATKTAMIKVEGMHCKMCSASVTKA
jgi:hypothetical protein